MTAEHILQDCRIHQREREKIWPSPVALSTKLYGTLEELRAKAAFIVDIGVDIYRRVHEEEEQQVFKKKFIFFVFREGECINTPNILNSHPPTYSKQVILVKG